MRPENEIPHSRSQPASHILLSIQILGESAVPAKSKRRRIYELIFQQYATSEQINSSFGTAITIRYSHSG